MPRGQYARKPRQVASVAKAEPPVAEKLPEASVDAPAPDVRSFADRNNPAKLTGAELHRYAHMVGMSRSEIAKYADNEAKIREQISSHERRRFRFDEDAAAA